MEVIFYPSLVKKGYICVNCEAIRIQEIHTINNILNRRAHIFEKAAEITTDANLSPTDINFIKSFCKTNPRDLNENGKLLKKQLNSTLLYYNEARKGDALSIDGPSNFIRNLLICTKTKLVFGPHCLHVC